MDLPKELSKIILIICNIFFIIAGLAILTLGVLVKVSGLSKHIETIIAEHVDARVLNTTMVVLIALGTVIFLVSLTGCCAALYENQCCLGTYIILLSVITMTELVACVFVGVVKNGIEGNIATSASRVLLDQYGINKEVTNSIDFIQYEMKCCGANNYTDYRALVLRIKKPVPYSCCYLTNTDPLNPEPINAVFCEAEAVSPIHLKYEYLHGEGCITFLKRYVKKYGIIILVVAMSILFLEVMLISLACCICCNKKKTRMLSDDRHVLVINNEKSF